MPTLGFWRKQVRETGSYVMTVLNNETSMFNDPRLTPNCTPG
jgi:hypothetical protein